MRGIYMRLFSLNEDTIGFLSSGSQKGLTIKGLLFRPERAVSIAGGTGTEERNPSRIIPAGRQVAHPPTIWRSVPVG
jgi:hypothetical protein